MIEKLDDKSVATGASLTASIVTVTTSVSVNSPSLTSYSNVSVPLKFAFGVYVNVPSEFTFTVPFVAIVLTQ